MRFLELNEIWEWCSQHGLAVEYDSQRVVLPEFANASRLVFAEEGPTGLEQNAATRCLQNMGEWDECLLWVTGWGIWTSSEDWPKYYAERGAVREKRSLDVAPGHLFFRSEGNDLARFLTLVFENGWDAHVLQSVSGRLIRHLLCSHDGWAELRSDSPNGDLAANDE